MLSGVFMEVSMRSSASDGRNVLDLHNNSLVKQFVQVVMSGSGLRLDASLAWGRKFFCSPRHYHGLDAMVKLV